MSSSRSSSSSNSSTKPARRRPGRRAAIVGLGRVGQTMTLLLHALGYQFETLITHRSIAAPDIARFGRPRVCRCEEEFPVPDLLLITTPDDAIGPVAAALAAREANWRRAVVLHCSGALGSQLLAPLAA